MLSPIQSPKSSTELVDDHFIENRTRLLEIAAFLDRLDRARDTAAHADFRILAFREALRVLGEPLGPRVERVQRIFSDPTTEPKDRLDQKSARGAYNHCQEGE